MFPAYALTCYCLGHCQPLRDDERLPGYNLTSAAATAVDTPDGGSWCLAKPGARCFSAVEQVYDPGSGSNVPERTYGCLPPDVEGGLFQCKGNLVPHLNPTAIACCSDQDYCNRRLAPMYDASPPPPPPTGSGGGEGHGGPDGGGGDGLFGSHMGEAASLALLVSLTLCFVLLVVFVALVYLKFKQREDSEKTRQKYHRTALTDPDGNAFSGGGGGGGIGGGTLSQLIDQSSGSGSGLPLLVQRTIAKQASHAHEAQ